MGVFFGEHSNLSANARNQRLSHSLCWQIRPDHLPQIFEIIKSSKPELKIIGSNKKSLVHL